MDSNRLVGFRSVKIVGGLILGRGDVVDGPPRSLLSDELGLVETVDGLSQGVVVRISDGADGWDGTDLGDASAVAQRRELTARVRVTQSTFKVRSA